MTNPLSHVGQTARPEASTGAPHPQPAHAPDDRQTQGDPPTLTAGPVLDVHLGVRFQVEAIPCGELFEGRFTLPDHGQRAQGGSDDSYRPTADNRWATEAEALTYATEAAHHAIEGILPFTNGEPRGG